MKSRMIKRIFNTLLFVIIMAFMGTLATTHVQADDLLVSSINTDNILRYGGQTGAFIDAFVSPGSGGLDTPRGLVLGPDGNLYVSSSNTNSVLRYNGQTGTFIDVFVSPGSGGLDAPGDLDFGPDGNLYVSSSSNGILRYDGTTGAFIDLFVPLDSGSVYELFAPTGFVFGPDGKLYVCDINNGSIVRFNGTTGAFIDYFVPSGFANLDAPRDLVFGSDNNAYVSCLTDNGSILRFNGTTGAFMGTFVSNGSGGVQEPEGLVFGPDSNLYVCDYPFLTHTGNILRFDGTTGAFIDEFVTVGSGGLDGPWFMIFAPLFSRGYVDIAHVTDINGNGFPEVAALNVDPDKGRPIVYIKDSDTGKLIKKIWFLSFKFTPKEMVYLKDMNGNGYSELCVLGVNESNGTVKSQIKDTKTKELLSTIWFPK